MSYYDILKIDKNATKVQIKKSYRKLAMKWHPDKNKSKGSKEKFQKITEAYNILYDDEKRHLYDNGTLNDEMYTNINPFDIFNSFFGKNNQHVKKNNDIQIKINVPLEKICKNKSLKVTFPRKNICKKCKGTKLKDGIYSIPPCNKCNGRGMIEKDVNMMGFLTVKQSIMCSKCHGKGTFITSDISCIECKGNGIIIINESIIFNTLQTALNENKMIFRNKGNQDENGIGDFILHIKIIDKNNFEINYMDLKIEKDIPFFNCISGYKFIINHPDGNKLEIDTNDYYTQVIYNNQELRIPGKGIFNNGDLYINFNVIYPRYISSDFRNKITKFLKDNRKI